MALKEYIGISRLTQAFTLLKGIFDTKEDAPEQITKQQWDALTPAQQESGDYIVIGLEPSPSGGGGGHTIQNESGTDLTQRDTLQFKGGLKVTDDSTNEKTVVDDTADEITWTEYNSLTPAQQSALDNTIVTDVPGADGAISADLLTKLWGNPSPTSAFAAQSITLSSDDYDFLLFVGVYSKDSIGRQFSVIASKGAGVVFSYALENIIRSRIIEYISDTSFSVGIGNNSSGSASPTTNNNICIPIAIYGIKKTVEVTFDALAKDVSTSASNCMMSDGETSVEEKLAEKIDNSAIANNLTTTAEGSVLDARQGKVLNDKITLKANILTASASGSVNVNFSTIIGPCLGIIYYNGTGYPAKVLLIESFGNSVQINVIYTGSSILTYTVSGSTVTFKNTYGGSVGVKILY